MAPTFHGDRKREIRTQLVKRLLSKKKKFSRNAHICALIHSTVKRVLGGKRTLGNSMDADHNFHSYSVDVDVKGGDRLI